MRACSRIRTCWRTHVLVLQRAQMSCILFESMAPLSPPVRTTLRQHLTENFSQGELEELAFDLGVDTETLLRETKSEFARALILHFEDRDEVERLAREALVRRPDAALERDLKNNEAQAVDVSAAATPPAASVSATQTQPASWNAGGLLPAVLALVALAAVLILVIVRQDGSTPRPVAQSSAATVVTPVVASDVPGTPLELNATVRSGLDDKLKPRDVWRVQLQAQRPYTIEVRSSVQDGISLGLMRPGASRAPDTVETADQNICAFASACTEAFTPAVAGDYTIVVYGMRPLVTYDLTVHDR